MAYKSIKDYGFYPSYTEKAGNNLDRMKKSSKNQRKNGPKLTVKSFLAKGMSSDEAIKETLKLFPHLSDEIIRGWIEDEKTISRREVDDDGR